MPPTPRPPIDRVLARLPRPDVGCWEWPGRVNVEGYGLVRNAGAGTGESRVHRVVYEALVGPVPPGFVLDHLCRVRRCARPDHLEPVSIGENVRRSPAWLTCKRGHDMATHGRTVSNGRRECWTCRNDGRRRRAAERRAAQKVTR